MDTSYAQLVEVNGKKSLNLESCSRTRIMKDTVHKT